VGGCGVAGDETDTPGLEFELGAATVTVDVALVAVLGTACVWAADDATVIRPARDVADAALPVPTESELTDSGFCAAGRIICGYCGKGKDVLIYILIRHFSLRHFVSRLMHSVIQNVDVKIYVVQKFKRHIIKITPTCFGSQRIHHWGDDLYFD